LEADIKTYTLAGFEAMIVCSRGRCDAPLPGRAAVEKVAIAVFIELSSNSALELQTPLNRQTLQGFNLKK
jgi:hypothetical protein